MASVSIIWILIAYELYFHMVAWHKKVSGQVSYVAFRLSGALCYFKASTDYSDCYLPYIIGLDFISLEAKPVNTTH